MGLLVLLLLPLLGRAQEIRISGRVVDGDTQEPIPFVSINPREAGEGTLSDESGYFQFIGPEKSRQDSLEFRTLGYARRAVLIEPGGAKSLLIELERQIVTGMISCPVKSFTIFNDKTTPLPNGEILTSLPGTQYAFFTRDETGKQLGHIRTISICIGDTTFPRKPFRIGLYNVDGEHHSPGNVLLAIDNVERIFYPDGNGWYTIDLIYYKLTVPSEGFFVSIQFFDIGDFYSRPFANGNKCRGYIMQPSSYCDEGNLWSGDGQRANWTLLKVNKETLNRYKNMIRVEVEPGPKVHP